MDATPSLSRNGRSCGSTGFGQPVDEVDESFETQCEALVIDVPAAAVPKRFRQVWKVFSIRRRWTGEAVGKGFDGRPQCQGVE
jgi:hypothetical protein